MSAIVSGSRGFEGSGNSGGDPVVAAAKEFDRQRVFAFEVFEECGVGVRRRGGDIADRCSVNAVAHKQIKR